MAALSKNGTEIGRIERLWHTDAHFSNRKILRNSGHGWKVVATVKPHVDPVEHFERRRQQQITNRASKPAMTALAAFLKPYPLSFRWKMKAALDMLGVEESDGIHSTLNDYKHKISFEEVQDLCKLYDAASKEQEFFRQQQIAKNAENAEG